MYLVERLSGMMTEGQPAEPHLVDCTGGLASATASYQDCRAGRIKVILNDGQLRR